MPATITCRPLRLNYFLRIPNVGDRINPAIVTAISQRPTVHVAGIREPHLFAVGSTMAATAPESQVWGTGVMHPELGIGGAVARNIHAVRGKLSHRALQGAGIKLRDIPLGDPGYLAPALLGITRSVTPKHTVGVVPHYVDRHSPHFRRLLAEPDVVDLNVHDDPEQFLRAMSECEAIVSSSLHGLIFAEALGIPNLWITAGGDIAGGSFKFDDWFSTTANPQLAAHTLGSEDTARQLAKCATLHDCTIDVEALQTAFPTRRLDDICEPQPRAIVPVDVCRSRPIPTFLISFNRGPMLEKVIASIKRLNRPTDIIIHDNGSTDSETVAILAKLERNGTRVARRDAITSADDLNQINDTVQEYFSNWAEPSRYIVSDGDIDMTISAPEALDVYDELLNSNRVVESVGPMLRISDIPTSYPLFNRVINRHIEQFWHKQPDWTETSFGPVAHIHTGIDTTFAVQRAGEPFRRLKQALRVYEPYEARHLDWYIDQIGSDIYSATSSAAISHWNNTVELQVYQNVKLEYASYYIVRRNHVGALEVCEEYTRKREPEITDDSQFQAVQPFVNASEAERIARIAHTETLRHARCTDVGRWTKDTSHQESWQKRGKLLADFVRPGERVFEFGAGNSTVPDALPTSCSYVASDAAPLKANIMRLDLNAPALPQLLGYDVGFFSGVLEYVHDLSRLVAYLPQYFQSVVCSYAVRAGTSANEIARRRYSGWFNDLSEMEFSGLFQRAGYRVSRQGDWAGQMLFRWDRI